MNIERAQATIDRFDDCRVAVVGDLMLDRYVWGEASRISEEAPVPIVAVTHTTSAPGGAANVLRNLASLGAKPYAFGIVGRDGNGEELSGLLEKLEVDTCGVLLDGGRRTTEKSRILAGNQQVVRVDVEDKEPISGALQSRLIEALEKSLKDDGLRGIIVEDYGKGCVDAALLGEVIGLAKVAGVPVALDPHPSNAFNVPGLTLLTPNRAETFSLTGSYFVPAKLPIEEDTALLGSVALLEANWAPEHLLVTLGAGGMALFHEGDPALHVPTLAREIFDVSGAGDTVVATFMLAFLRGASPEESAILSNHAAGIVVGKIGTVPVTKAELIESFRGLASSPPRSGT